MASLPLLAKIDTALSVAKSSRWAADRGIVFPIIVPCRQQVWKAMLRHVVEPITYLEFGVAHGDSCKWWADHLGHGGTVLHGFDTFTGMPESGGPWSKGDFSNGGRIPMLCDTRIKFFKGKFCDTLPDYRLPHSEQRVFNCDADLYSSTAFVLNHFAWAMKPGDLIYFDEFHIANHEQLAFDEMIVARGIKVKPIACSFGMEHAAFKVI